MLVSIATALPAFLLPVAPPTGVGARVVFVVPPTKASPFGATSPEPAPSWRDVATHLAARLPGFDERIAADVVLEGELAETEILVGVGCERERRSGGAEQRRGCCGAALL